MEGGKGGEGGEGWGLGSIVGTAAKVVVILLSPISLLRELARTGSCRQPETVSVA